jgi:hypothetical protein
MHVHCMLDNKGYRHILGTCNSFYCSKAAVVMQMFLIVNIYTFIACLVIKLNSGTVF